MNRREWADRAACNGRDPKLWLGDKDAYVRWADLTEAINTCNGCPVQAECLEFQMDFEEDMPVAERWGIFGGLTPEQRGALARRRLTASERRRLERIREAVALSDAGLAPVRIAERMGVSKSTAARWIQSARTA